MFRGVLPVDDGDPREAFVERKRLAKPEGGPSGRLRLRIVERLVGDGTDVGVLPGLIALSSRWKAQRPEAFECILAQLPQPVRPAVSKPPEPTCVAVKRRDRLGHSRLHS